jgi:1,2-dihydroxy-3-keto-5-methylthiopentene dioxygenase
MQLTWLEEQPAQAPCTPADLEAAGVTYAFLSTDPARYEPALAELCAQKGYVARDEVALSPTTPNLQLLKDKFKDEHLHTDDEVRFVLEGAGIFDIRSADDRWMRVVVEPGDVLVVPAGRNHRFLLTDVCQIRCVRLFRDMTGWTPVYRTASP